MPDSPVILRLQRRVRALEKELADRRQAEDENNQLLLQLQQSQKMEALLSRIWSPMPCRPCKPGAGGCGLP